MALAVISFWALTALGQNAVPAASASQTAKSSSPTTLPAWLPFPIPPRLYQYWRKYGPWDTKQQGFKYRDYTLFNFGSTGAAAGLDANALLALAQATNPNQTDLRRLDEAELETHFGPNSDALDELRVMAEQDSHLIRIAADFTDLDNKSAWPREDIGITEARWDEYRSLFQKLSLQEGIVRTEDFPGAIFFVAVAKGMCTGGSSAGYVYSTQELSPTSDTPTETLDKEPRNIPGQYYAYVFKQLKPNWYVFYEMDW
jgi:hypothetical protein